MSLLISLFFFFQAEDGIRDVAVTGVQTCALPILSGYVGDQRRERCAQRFPLRVWPSGRESSSPHWRRRSERPELRLQEASAGAGGRPRPCRFAEEAR